MSVSLVQPTCRCLFNQAPLPSVDIAKPVSVPEQDSINLFIALLPVDYQQDINICISFPLFIA